MSTGILICGLNGSGKSTLGKALALEIGFHFIDSEKIFFPNPNSNNPYSNPISHETAKKMLMEEVQKNENFVLATVKGDYSTSIISLFRYIFVLEVPKRIRLDRIKNRSLQKFQDRILPGGDLFEQEAAFIQKIQSRTEYYVEDWLQTMACPIFKLNGTRPIEDNISIIKSVIGM